MIQQKEGQSLQNQKAVNLLQQNRVLSRTSLSGLMIILIIIMMVSLASAIYLLVRTLMIVERRFQYYSGNGQAYIYPGVKDSIAFNFTLSQALVAPVYIFYEIGYNYQNLTNYYNSKSLRQLAGESITYIQLQRQCYRVQNFNQRQFFGFSINKNQSCKVNNSSSIDISEQKISNPCGFLPRTYFNDTFFILKNVDNKSLTLDNNYTVCDAGLISGSASYDLLRPDDQQCGFSFDNCYNYSKSVLSRLNISKNGILEPDSLEKSYFKNSINSSDPNNPQWVNKQSQRFIQWVSSSGTPHSPILWGQINEDLNQNEFITIFIFLNHDSARWDGYRMLILSNSKIPQFAMGLVTAVLFVIFTFSGLTLFFLYYIHFRKVFAQHEKKNIMQIL